MKHYQKFIEEYYHEMSRKITPLCETTLPHHPDFETARSLGTKYFYDPSIIQYLRCYANNIAEYSGGRRLISQFETSKTLSRGKMGAGVIYNKSVLVKVPLNNDDEEDVITSMAEFIIGNELNKLELPNLMKTYAGLSAPIPRSVLHNDNDDDDEKEVENIAIGNDEGIYLMLELVNSRGDLRYMVKKWAEEDKFHEILVCFLQIFYTLWIANDKTGFVHCDLHDSNILVVEMENPVAIPYFLPNGETVVLVTPYVVKIIDYGFSRINLTVPKSLQNKYGKNISIIGVDWDETNKTYEERVQQKNKVLEDEIEKTAKSPTLSTPFFDLFKICAGILENVYRRNEYYGRILSVVFEYIYFLGRYVNFTTRIFNDVRAGDLDKYNNLDRYFDLNPKMAKEAERNLSMTDFQKHLHWVLFTYLKVQYVFSSFSPSFSPTPPTSHKNVLKNVYWLECNEKHIQRLVKEGFSGMNACRTLEETKTEMNYNLYNISTLSDYLEKHRNQWPRLREKEKEMLEMANHAYLRAKIKVDEFIKNIKNYRKNYRIFVMKHKIMVSDLFTVRKFLNLKDNSLEEYKKKIDNFITW